jgi:peptide/nickel transport system permease protein
VIGRSYLRSAVEPLRLVVQDRLSLTGLVILALVTLMALTAPWIATHDPRAINEREEASVLVRGADGWRLLAPIGPRAISAAAAGGGVVIAVGREGSAHLFDGDWRALPTGVSVDLDGVAVDGAGNAIAVGAGGTVLVRPAGGDWRAITAPEPVDLLDVAWIGRGLAALVGADETFWLLDLDRPVLEPVDTPVGRGMELRAVALDGTSVLAMGERGLALRHDLVTGATELVRLPGFRDINGLHVDPSGLALAVGERGTLLRREADGRWVEDDAPDTRALRAGWIGADGSAIAAGRSGVVLERVGDHWVRVDTGTDRHLRALAVLDGTAYALGTDPFVNRLAPPGREHWFGTDHLGRDLLSQNLYGSRIALLVGFLGAALVVLIGANVGLIAGYFRGRTETVLMRIVDVMYGIPFEPFALILVLLFDPSLTIVILAVALLTWRTVARLIRAQVLSLTERPFVKAARVAGASDLRIMYLHIFPNVLPLVFLELAIIVGVAIIAEATLSFLGLGPPQSISWGGILHNARLSGAWRTAWWWNIPPGLFIMMTVMSVFFISRSLEVIANPRLRAR